MKSDRNPSINATIRDILVHLVRQVPWGPSRAELESEASSLRQKAMWERGMCDNLSTADWLHWEADLYQLAAEGRFPRDSDQQVTMMAAQVAYALEVEFRQETDMDDACDVTRNARVFAAVQKVLDGCDPETKRNLEGALRQKREEHANHQDSAEYRH